MMRLPAATQTPPFIAADSMTPAFGGADAERFATLVDDLVSKRDASSAVSRDRTVFTLLTGAQAGMVVSLSDVALVIGRGSDVDVRIANAWLSERHVRIRRQNDGIFIQDLGSTNGTFIGRERLSGERKIEPGDRVRLGRDVELRLALLDDLEEGAARRLYEASVRDATTGVYNRQHFEARLATELAFAFRQRSTLSVLFIDLDDFKHVNDAFGHHVGDAVLRVVGASLQRLLRPEDVLARYGGDEFVVLARATSPRNAQILAERMRRHVEGLPMTASGNDFGISISVGVATLDPDAPSSAPSLVASADRAMYDAKSSGRNRVAVAPRG
jgi:two-component system, cell cycle response regulator